MTDDLPRDTAVSGDAALTAWARRFYRSPWPTAWVVAAMHAAWSILPFASFPVTALVIAGVLVGSVAARVAGIARLHHAVLIIGVLVIAFQFRVWLAFPLEPVIP